MFKSCVSIFSFVAVSNIILVSHTKWASSLPNPQWGIAAAAEAANQIDTERFQAIAAHAESSHEHSHFAELGSETREEDDDEVLTPSYYFPSYNPNNLPISRMEAPKELNNQRQYYPSYNDPLIYHPHQRQGPQQHWGVWKYGLDNMYYFLSNLFSHTQISQ